MALIEADNKHCGNVQNMHNDISQWYIATYPNDEMGQDLKEGISFKDLLDALTASQEVYTFLGCADSIIRERVFTELSLRMGVGYEDVYKLWLKQ